MHWNYLIAMQMIICGQASPTIQTKIKTFKAMRHELKHWIAYDWYIREKES